MNKLEEQNISSEINLEKKKSSRVIIIFIMIIISFFIGLIIGSSSSPENNSEPYVFNKNNKSNISKNINFNLFWEVWDLIQNKYIEKNVNEVDMFYGAQM